jgi:hypothetical protein
MFTTTMNAKTICSHGSSGMLLLLPSKGDGSTVMMRNCSNGNHVDFRWVKDRNACGTRSEALQAGVQPSAVHF